MLICGVNNPILGPFLCKTWSDESAYFILKRSQQLNRTSADIPCCGSSDRGSKWQKHALVHRSRRMALQANLQYVFNVRIVYGMRWIIVIWTSKKPGL